MGRLLNLIIHITIVSAVFLVPLVWSPWTFESFEFPKQELFFFLVFLGLSAWMSKMVFFERELHFKRNPLNLPVLVFSASLILSTLFSADLFSSLLGSYGRFADGFFVLLSGAGLYFLVLNTVEKPGSLARWFLLSFSLVLLSSFLSLFGILQKDLFLASQSQESFSMFVALVLSFLVFLSVRPRARSLPSVGNLLLVVGAFAMLLVLNHAGAWAVVLAALFLALLSGLLQRFWTFGQARLQELWLPLVLLLLAGGVLLSPVKIGQAQEENALSHKVSWSIAFETLGESAKNLVLGTGPGTFAADFSLHKPVSLSKTDLWQVRFDRGSSFFAELLSAQGILGFLSFSFLLLWFSAAGMLAAKRKETLSYFFSTLAAVLVLLLYHQTASLLLSFWLFLSLTAVSWKLKLPELRIPLRGALRSAARAAAVLWIFLFAASVFFGAMFFLADTQYAAARENPSLETAEKIERGLKAASLNPWQAEYRIFLSRLYLEQAREELGKGGADSQEQASRAVSLAIAFGKGDDEEGIAGAVELSPNKVALWESLGTLYKSIVPSPGALEWGIRSFEKAMELEPANPLLSLELGKLYLQKEETSRAKEYFQEALSLKPDYAPAFFQLALAKEQEGKAEEALADMQEAASRFQLSPEDAFQLGRLLYNAGETKKAAQVFQRVLRAAPNHSNALFALGTAYAAEGKTAEAISAFKRVLELNPENEAVQKKLQELSQ